MADDRYGKILYMLLRTLNGKQQKIWEKECAGYTRLSNPHDLEEKEVVKVKSPINLLTILLEMMIPYFDYFPLSENLSRMVEQRKVSDTLTEIIVRAHPYTKNEIPELISRMCKHHVYENISPEDANEIITRLNLSRHVFCVQPDPESGACLVVLEELAPFYSYSANACSIQPREKFRNAYEEFNRSRTVCVSQSQKDRLLSDEINPSVEFSSVLQDGQIEVVFRRGAIQTVVPEIKRLVEIDNIERRLKELRSSSK
jgi:hypothetical protein